MAWLPPQFMLQAGMITVEIYTTNWQQWCLGHSKPDQHSIGTWLADLHEQLPIILVEIIFHRKPKQSDCPFYFSPLEFHQELLFSTPAASWCKQQTTGVFFWSHTPVNLKLYSMAMLTTEGMLIGPYRGTVGIALSKSSTFLPNKKLTGLFPHMHDKDKNLVAET